MLTSQNVFIANLALSDLLLCTVTMPLTLLDMLTKYWPLGPDMNTVGKVAIVTACTYSLRLRIYELILLPKVL